MIENFLLWSFGPIGGKSNNQESSTSIFKMVDII